MMMVGVVLGVVGAIVVVNVIDQDQDQLADLSSAFCSSLFMGSWQDRKHRSNWFHLCALHQPALLVTWS